MRIITIKLTYEDEDTKHTINHMFDVDELERASVIANDIIVGTFKGTILYSLAQQPGLEFLRK